MQFSRPPILLSGLILGLFGLGNLTAAYHDTFYHLFNSLALLLWLHLTIAIIRHFSSYREDLGKAPILSSFATYPMASMLLAAYLVRLSPGLVPLAQLLWYLALALHLFMILLFSWKFVLRAETRILTPSWTVLYVGIAMAGLTNPVVGQPWLGAGATWFGLLASLLLYPFLYREAGRDRLPDLLKPQWAIYCAPFSLLLGSYIRLAGPTASSGLILLLLGLSQAFYLLVLVLLPRIIRLGFQPTWVALTFPLVNTAFALQLSQPFLDRTELSLLAHAEAGLAALVVLAVLLHYSRAFLGPKPAQAKNPI